LQDADSISQILVRNRGDIINLVGILIGLIGFGIAIRQLSRTKKAAKAAERAALQTQKALRHLDTVMDFSSAITMMEEIKRHHRSDNWIILPDRYSVLRQKLVAIKSNNAHVSEEQRLVLQGAIQQFSDLEKTVERGLMKNPTVLKADKLNELVSGQMDALNEVLMDIRNKLDI
jgi:hypothetical protein